MPAAGGTVRTKQVGDYVLSSVLGEGTFGKVRLGTKIDTGQSYAVKVIPRAMMSTPEQAERFWREVFVMNVLQHPNIIRLYEVLETRKSIYLVMEQAAGGELFEYIIAHDHVPEEPARKFFTQILLGVDYCHRAGVIHRDLKPENLLLDQEGNIKIIDFGFANFISPKTLRSTYCGSYSYAAPEILAHTPYTGPEVDMWSLGVILFALLTGELPFDSTDVDQLYQQIQHRSYTFPPDIELSHEARNLVVRLLEPKTPRRLTMDEAFQHPWICPPGTVPPERLDTITEPLPEVNEALLKEIKRDYGFEPSEVRAALAARRLCAASSVYRVLAQKRASSGSASDSTRLSQRLKGRILRGQRSGKSKVSVQPVQPAPATGGSGQEGGDPDSPAHPGSQAPPTSVPGAGLPDTSTGPPPTDGKDGKDWVSSLGDVIMRVRKRDLGSGDDAALSRLVFMIRRPQNGLLRTHTVDGKAVPDSIHGYEITDWFMRTFGHSLKEASLLGQGMYQRAFVVPQVGSMRKFQDNETIYTFLSPQARLGRLSQIAQETAEPDASTTATERQLVAKVSEIQRAVIRLKQSLREAELGRKVALEEVQRLKGRASTSTTGTPTQSTPGGPVPGSPLPSPASPKVFTASSRDEVAPPGTEKGMSPPQVVIRGGSVDPPERRRPFGSHEGAPGRSAAPGGGDAASSEGGRRSNLSSPVSITKLRQEIVEVLPGLLPGSSDSAQTLADKLTQACALLDQVLGASRKPSQSGHSLIGSFIRRRRLPSLSRPGGAAKAGGHTMQRFGVGALGGGDLGSTDSLLSSGDDDAPLAVPEADLDELTKFLKFLVRFDLRAVMEQQKQQQAKAKAKGDAGGPSPSLGRAASLASSDGGSDGSTASRPSAAAVAVLDQANEQVPYDVLAARIVDRINDPKITAWDGALKLKVPADQAVTLGTTLVAGMSTRGVALPRSICSILELLSRVLNSPGTQLTSHNMFSGHVYLTFVAQEAVDWLMRNYQFSLKNARVVMELLVRLRLVRALDPALAPLPFHIHRELYSVADPETHELVPVEQSPADLQKEMGPDQTLASPRAGSTSRRHSISQAAPGTLSPLSPEGGGGGTSGAGGGAGKALGRFHKGLPVRSMRAGAFNTYVSLELSAKHLLKTFPRVLGQLGIAYQIIGTTYLCTHGAIRFELEPCFLRENKSIALRHKRLAGDTFKYKRLFRNILRRLKK